MRFRYAAVWIVAMFLIVAKIEAAIKELPSSLVFGKPYINLKDYSQSRGLQFSFDSQNDTITLSSKWSKLEFTVDSRQCSVNGVNVWLSFPIAKQNGVIYISPIDAKTTIDPILQPPRYLVSKKIKTVCIDPGHGGKDPGNLEGKHIEKVYTLSLAYELKRQLEKAGLKVFLTRTSDKFIDLPQRAEVAKTKGADLFISIHFNSSDTRSVKGIETYCVTPAGADSTNVRGNTANKSPVSGNKNDARNMFLAWNIQKYLVKSMDTEDRGVKRARFAVLKDAAVPAVLIECGFMSNPEEMQKIQDVAWRRQIAKGIADGILNYKKQIER